MDKGYIYRVITNPVYIGQIVHKDQCYQGQHEVIITQKIWDAAQAIFQINSHSRGNYYRRQTPAILCGLIKCAEGNSGLPSGKVKTTSRCNAEDFRCALRTQKKSL
jgi:hypothetical protein